MTRAIGIGLLGCGVVGTGILRLLRENREVLEQRLGAPLQIVKIAVRDGEKPRAAEVPKALLTGDPYEVIGHEGVDVVVEVIGGVEPAGSLLRAAMDRKKPIVTANKALLAEQGIELIGHAERSGVDLYFEAAACGGIPIIRVLREALASDRIVALRGIVNGTSNYVLTRMHEEGTSYERALEEAQRAGYAEADPTLDVGGGDAAHKLTILAMLAFGAQLTTADVAIEGIDRLTADDVRFAKRFGYVIKPLAIARAANDGLELRVHPALVRERSVLASISGALNAVYVEGAMLGPCLLSGLGAGALPTAMSVVSDIVDVARNLRASAPQRVPSHASRAANLTRPRLAPRSTQSARFYLRFMVEDRPGVLASIAGVLGSHDVSIHQLLQEGHGQSVTDPVPVVMFTHEAPRGRLDDALREIEALPAMRGKALAMPIDEA